MSPSDPCGIVAPEVGNDLCTNRLVAVVRPETAAPTAVSVFPGVEMAGPFGGTGRPTAEESERRRVEFVRLVAAGEPLDEAARAARINPWRALSLISAREMRELLVAAA